MQADYMLVLPGEISGADEVLMGSLEGELLLGNYRLNLGYSYSEADLTPDDTMHYFSLAYAYSEFSPYIFAARLKLDFDGLLPAHEPMPEPWPEQEPSPEQELLQLLPRGDITLTSIAAGVRWQLSEQLVVKAQLENLGISDEVQLETDSVVDGGNILTLVLDGVF